LSTGGTGGASPRDFEADVAKCMTSRESVDHESQGLKWTLLSRIFVARADDGNRTRVLSLGIRRITQETAPDLRRTMVTIARH
jgi:hypothetical protein